MLQISSKLSISAPASDGGIDSRELTLIVGHLKTGDFAAALENVKRLQKDHPDDARLLVLEGVAQIGGNERDLAAATFSRAIELDPQTVDARLNLAQLRRQEGEFDAAKTLLETVVALRPGHYLAMLDLASLAGRAGDVNLQANWLERAVAAQPNLPALRLQLALFYLGHQQAQKALEAVQPALEGNPDSIEFLGIAGQAQLQSGQIDEAVATFERLAKLPPESAEAYFLLARAYGLAGKHQEMQAQLNRALELDPDHLPSQVALVRFLVLNGKEEEAGTHMQALKAAHPDNPDVLAQEGWMQLREGHAEEAAKTLKVAFDRSGPGVSREIVGLPRAGALAGPALGGERGCSQELGGKQSEGYSNAPCAWPSLYAARPSRRCDQGLSGRGGRDAEQRPRPQQSGMAPSKDGAR